MAHERDFRPVHVLMLGPTLDVQGGVSAVERLILEHVPEGVHLRLLPTSAQTGNLGKLIYFIPAYLRLLVTLLTTRVDVVHMHFSIQASIWRKSLCVPLAKLFRKPVILHAHAGGFPEYLASRPAWQRRWFLRTLRKADTLIVLSESWRQYYLELTGLPEDCVVALPNPIRLPEAIPDRTNRPVVTLVFLGRMDDNKGPARILGAVSLLSDKLRAKVRLLMAGDGAVQEVRRAAKTLGLEGQAVVEGWVSPERRDQMLSDGDIFVLPSKAEGMPMSLLEAMAWGLPVVTTPVGGIPEVVRHGESGFLVQPTDERAICEAIRQLVEDEELRLRMGAAARATAERFHISHYWTGLQKIYLRTLQQQKE
jgi:glycosyltransferase involved in cell wall biosynthesis